MPPRSAPAYAPAHTTADAPLTPLPQLLQPPLTLVLRTLPLLLALIPLPSLPPSTLTLTPPVAPGYAHAPAATAAATAAAAADDPVCCRCCSRRRPGARPLTNTPPLRPLPPPRSCSRRRSCSRCGYPAPTHAAAPVTPPPNHRRSCSLLRTLQLRLPLAGPHCCSCRLPATALGRSRCHSCHRCRLTAAATVTTLTVAPVKLAPAAAESPATALALTPASPLAAARDPGALAIVSV